MKKILKVTGILFLIIIAGIVCVASYIKLALPNVGNAPVMNVLRTPGRIQRGEYLANHVMVCMDCHSTRNWSQLAGPLVPGTRGKGGEVFDEKMGFPGTFYAPNITPAGISSWTDGELFRAITTGVRKNGKPIFPVMPHALYGQLDQEDIQSVIAYIRSLPAIKNQVPASRPAFPMNLILNTIPQKANLHPIPDTADKISYGKYLFTASACVDCHTPFEKGKLVTALFMAGGREFNMPGGTVRSANLTPDAATGIGNWNREAFISRFKIYDDSARMHQPAPDNGFNTPMPWTMFAGMKAQDLGAIYEYLHSLQPIHHAVQKFSPAKKNG